MREERTIQASIFDVFSKHELGVELKAMSDWLDDHRELLAWMGRGENTDIFREDRCATDQ